METLTIKIKDTRVLKIIHGLEDFNFIEIIGPTQKKIETKLSVVLSSSIS
jgi:hypothetical protein